MATQTLENATSNTIQVFRAHFSKFVRSDRNLRNNVERENLLALIKADLGVKIPGYVYPETFNIIAPETQESLMVIYEMNSRHWCLQQLANDEEYLKAGGSLELPYMILSDDIANNPVRERLFAISLGISNEKLSPLEAGKGYVEALELGIQQEIDKIENFAELTEDEQNKKRDLIRIDTIKFIIKETGLSKQSIYEILAVMNAVKSNENISNSLDSGKLTFSSAAKLITGDRKDLNSEKIEKTLVIAEKVQANSNRKKIAISESDIVKSKEILKHPELAECVIQGKLNPNYTDAVIKAAKQAKTDIPTIIENASLFGEVNPENIQKVLDVINVENIDESGDSEIEETKVQDKTKKPETKIAITTEDLAKAKDSCSSFNLLLSSLEDSNFTNISEDKLVILGQKVENIYLFLQKNLTM